MTTSSFDEMLQADAEFLVNDGFGVTVTYLRGGGAFAALCDMRVTVHRSELDAFAGDEGQFRRNRARVRIPRTRLPAVVPGKDLIQGLRPGEGQKCVDARVTQILDDSDPGSWLLEVMW